MFHQKKFLSTLLAGLIALLLGECSILLGQESLKVWVTPLCWTGYILLLDSYLYFKRGHSRIQNSPLQVLSMVPISAALWAIFEGYNLILQNWEYIHLPTNSVVKHFGFFWSFGTILPALLETNDLLEHWGWFKNVRITPGRTPPKGLIVSFCLGVLFLIYPLVTTSPFDFPPVWLGFIFLLEPINYHFKGESLLRRLEQGQVQRFLTLMVAGGIMGFFWEFWNFWAGSKWIYHIPVPLNLKIFEMPLWGFLGFFSFSLEFYVMYYFVLLMAERTPITKLYRRHR